jgi:hypothetical protein
MTSNWLQMLEPYTADTTSMYTDISTEPALEEISAYLRAHEGLSLHHYKPKP